MVIKHQIKNERMNKNPMDLKSTSRYKNRAYMIIACFVIIVSNKFMPVATRKVVKEDFNVSTTLIEESQKENDNVINENHYDGNAEITVFAAKAKVQEDNEMLTKKTMPEIVSEISPKMDITETSGISKDDFIFLLENCKYDKSGILKENASLIWEECQIRQLNEFAIVGIISAESGWADPEISELTAEKKNIMSIKNDAGDYKTYETYSECILDAIRILSEEYIDENGRYKTSGKLNEIGDVYSECGEEWSCLVANCAEMSTRALMED